MRSQSSPGEDGVQLDRLPGQMDGRAVLSQSSPGKDGLQPHG